MTSEYTCIIVDDEADAIELLITKLSRLYKNIQIAGSYTSWEPAFNTLKNQPSDLLILDISMPEKSGLDMLRLLPGLKSEIIFTTAYHEYAIDAFKFAATGYILKPVDDEDLVNAVDKAIERAFYKKAGKANHIKAVNRRIGIPNVNGVEYVNIEEIMYFETVRGYTKVVTINGDITSSFSIGKFKAITNDHAFYQPHRSYIVNLNSILSYKTPGIIIMPDKKEIPISRDLKDEFLGFFDIATKKNSNKGNSD